MSSWVEQVAEFRRALCLGLVREKGSLGRVRISELEYDVKVGREALKGEVAETVEAMSDLIFELEEQKENGLPVGDKEAIVSKEDLVKIAEGLGGTVVACIEVALSLGIDFDKVMERIYESNMSKVGVSLVARLEDGRVAKGPNYRPPVLGDCVV